MLGVRPPPPLFPSSLLFPRPSISPSLLFPLPSHFLHSTLPAFQQYLPTLACPQLLTWLFCSTTFVGSLLLVAVVGAATQSELHNLEVAERLYGVIPSSSDLVNRGALKDCSHVRVVALSSDPCCCVGWH